MNLSNNSVRRERPQRDDCEIDVKRSKSGGIKIRFRGNCRKEQLDVARDRANSGEI